VNRALFVGYAVILALCGWWWWSGLELRFYVLQNDFWGLFFLSEHLSLKDTGTLHNGFYPIGYPLLLRILIGPNILVTAFAVSVIAAALVLAVQMHFLSRHLSPWIAVACIGALGIHPMFFQHAITAGTDITTVALAATGSLTFVSGLMRGSTTLALIGGALMGGSGLMRHHGFLFSLAVVAAGLACWPRRWQQVCCCAAMVGVAGGVQVAINVAAGVPPFQTAQAFNVYKMFNPVDWFHLKKDYPPNVLDVIRLSPGRYFEAYKAHLYPELYLLWPAAIATVLVERSKRPLAAFTLITGAVFLPLQAIGGSPRGPMPLLPLCAVAVALCLEAVMTRRWVPSSRVRTSAAAIGTVSVAVAAMWFWPVQSRAYVTHFARVEQLWAQVETQLRSDGVQHPSQVFTDSFEFYFVSVRSPSSMDYHPRTTGGWAQIDLYGSERVHPPLRTDTLPNFLSDAREQGVTHLVLTGTAGSVLAALGHLQAGAPVSGGMREVASLGWVRIFDIRGWNPEI
jgi:hypothetical protein